MSQENTLQDYISHKSQDERNDLIAELRKEIAELRGAGFNTAEKPVAWVNDAGTFIVSDKWKTDNPADGKNYPIPLYTKASNIEERTKLSICGSPKGAVAKVYFDDTEIASAEVTYVVAKPPEYRKLRPEDIADMIRTDNFWELSAEGEIVSVHFDRFARAIEQKLRVEQ